MPLGRAIFRIMLDLNPSVYVIIDPCCPQMLEKMGPPDITGFGLLGHLIEMAEGSGLGAELYYSQIPIIDSAKIYLGKKLIPDATYRNWNSYSQKVAFVTRSL